MKNNQIHVRAEFTIEKGKIEEFKKLILDMSRMVENNEPDTINYQFYLNRSETMCLVHETYTNSDSTVASKTILPKIFNIAKINRLDVYGNPSEELKKVLTSFNSQTFNLFTGFSRQKWNDFFKTV
jgi:hypothetical protein